MIITDLEGRSLYRNRNDFEPERIIDAIVKAGGIENINLTFMPMISMMRKRLKQ